MRRPHAFCGVGVGAKGYGRKRTCGGRVGVYRFWIADAVSIGLCSHGVSLWWGVSKRRVIAYVMYGRCTCSRSNFCVRTFGENRRSR